MTKQVVFEEVKLKEFTLAAEITHPVRAGNGKSAEAQPAGAQAAQAGSEDKQTT